MSERDIMEQEAQEREYESLQKSISHLVNQIKMIKGKGVNVGIDDISLSNIEIIRHNKESEFIRFCQQKGLPYFLLMFPKMETIFVV